MKYSIIIGLSENCYEFKRFDFILKTIVNSFRFIENKPEYEILIPCMYSSGEIALQHMTHLGCNCIHGGIKIRSFYIPLPVNGYFSNSIQYNFAIRAAKGEYIIQTDTDVCWREDMVQNIEKILSADPDAFIGCDFRFIKEEYSDYSDDLYSEVTRGEVPEHKIRTQLADAGLGWFYGNLQIFKKSLMVEAQGYDERMRNWGEWDNDWNLRARMRCKARALPQWSMYHLYHDHRAHKPYPEGWDFDRFHKLLLTYGREDKRFVKNDDNWGTTESKYFKHPDWEGYPE